MPLQSPKHSFVDFENRLNGIILPAYQAQFGFQFLFSSDMVIPRTGTVNLYAGDAAKTTALFPLTASVYDVCFWGVITKIATSDFPVTVPSGQIIPAATYTTLDDFLTALQLVGFNAYSTTFLQCCTDNLQNYKISFTNTSGKSKKAFIDFYRGLVYIERDANQETVFNTNGIPVDACYSLAITSGATSDDINVVSQTSGATSEYTVTLGGTLRNGDEVDFSLTDGTGTLNFGEIASSLTTLEIMWGAVEAELELVGFTHTRSGNTLHIFPRSGTITGNTSVIVANPTVSVTVYGFSNLFKRVASADYMTFLSYYGNEDQYDFHYPADYLVNKLWLPLYVQKPSYPITRKIYRKSNKQYKVLSATIEQQWEVEIDSFQKEIHDRIIVALEHDNKHFTSTYPEIFDEDVFANGDYSIAWPDRFTDRMIREAKAKCTVLQIFEGRNSNCEKRPVCIALPTQTTTGECTAVTITPTTLPDAVVGIPYSVDIPLTGTQPFVLSGPNGPGWMTFAVNVDHVELRGTPDVEDSNVTVSFHISNCAGEDAADFTDMIDINQDVTTSGDVSLSYDNIGGWSPNGTNTVTGGSIIGPAGTSVVIEMDLDSSYTSASAQFTLNDGSAHVYTVTLPGSSHAMQTVTLVIPLSGSITVQIIGTTALGGTTYYEASIRV